MDQAGSLPFSKLPTSRLNQIFLGVIVISVIGGLTTGYILGQKPSTSRNLASSTSDSGSTEPPKSAQADKSTFRDFAEGTIEKRPEPKNPQDYVEGTHTLKREGAVPVALTSSVVDLSEFEGKKVKVYGETQKAIKEGWLMDVGLVEEQ